MSLMPFLHQPVETTTLKDFYPVTQWKEKKPLPIIGGMHVLVDQATGKEYKYKPVSVVWGQCLGLALATIPVQLVSAVVSNIKTAGRIFSGDQHIGRHPYPPTSWRNIAYAILGKELPKDRHVKERLQDLARIIFSPAAVVLLQLSAFYGIVAPRNGYKLYCAIETLLHGSPLLTTGPIQIELWK
jgi:hypothetical protein